jgi:hypothetical protein
MIEEAGIALEELGLFTDLYPQNRHPNGGKRVKSTPKETNAT